jgi:hypothetical protein
MAKSLSREEKLALYTKAVETNPAAELKGDTVPYTSLNGHMYSYLSKDDNLALKLPKEELEAFLKKYKTTLMAAYGIVQKEFAVVPDALLAKTKELKPYFDKSYEYVASLKPKPTKKAAKKTK